MKGLLVALLSELVKAVADVEGIDQVSVGIFARAAREAGLISQKGRGRGAAHMSVRDAANLLIAVNGSPLAKKVPAFVPLFRELEPTSESSSRWDNEIGDALRTAATFGEALETLIRLSHPDGEGGSIMDYSLEPPSKDIKWAESRGIELPHPYIELELGQPYIEASIKLFTIETVKRRHNPFAFPTEFASFTYRSEFEPPKSVRQEDRQIRTSITQATLKRVAELELHDDDR